MARSKRKVKRANKGKLILLLVLILAVLAELAFLMQPDDVREEGAAVLFPGTEAVQEQTEPEETFPEEESVPQMQPTEETEVPDVTQAWTYLEFPLVTSEGKLEIESLFQYSGSNPDAQWQEGTDIAAISVRNISGEYLRRAQIRITAPDGSERQFVLEELPVGGSAMAFELNNRKTGTEPEYTELVCQTEFAEAEGWKDQILAETEGITVTLTNIGDTELTGIQVCCRMPMDDAYFGGSIYRYEIERLAPGESTILEAYDCILGAAEVVRIEYSESY